MSNSVLYVAFAAANVILLKEVNSVVTEPYMDEPFHVPQAQAYCRGEWSTWDPKITTPPGLYVLSVILQRIFVFKCSISVLRLTPLLTLLSLPILLTRLICLHRRIRPSQGLLEPSLDALALSLFPIAWFFGFLYYTDVPSLAFVICTVVCALNGKHTLAALTGIASCTFRQTNIIWVIYAWAYSQVTLLRFKRAESGKARLYDPPATGAQSSDIFKILLSIPNVLPEIFAQALPYFVDTILFGVFVYWNGGIVLGDKSNHIPSLHIPQLYYFIAFATIFGWPALVSGPGGVTKLFKEVRSRMFGNILRTALSVAICLVIAVTIHFFTIHHPFLLSDNRHYTFYIWRRVFRFHPLVPYVFAPGYLACVWAWFLRVGKEQSLLQTLVLPICTIPTLLLTPLLEPRYFLIPYVLLRAQVTDMPSWAVSLEGAWYTLINCVTMYIFLYKDREGVGRFMW